MVRFIKCENLICIDSINWRCKGCKNTCGASVTIDNSGTMLRLTAHKNHLPVSDAQIEAIRSENTILMRAET